MSGVVKLPLLRPISFKPSPYSERRNKLNLIDCLDNSSSKSLSDIRATVDAGKSDVRYDLHKFKVRYLDHSHNPRSFLTPRPTLANAKRKSPSVIPPVDQSHERSKSYISEVAPSKAHPTPFHRPSPSKPSVIEQDMYEEYFDTLIRNRDTLRNPEDVALLKPKKRISESKLEKRLDVSPIKPSYKKPALAKAKVKQISSIGEAKSKMTVISKVEVKYNPLIDNEGEDRLKKKIYHYRKEILRMLSQVEEYVVAI